MRPGLYDATTGEERLPIDRAASQLQFSDEGKTLTGAVGGAIYRWDTATGKSPTPDLASDSVVDQILVTSDGGRIVTRGQGGDAHIWDGRNGNHLRFLKTWRSAMTLSPDDRYLAWTDYNDGIHIRLYDMAAHRLVERFPVLKGSSRVEASFTADGKSLITIEHQDGMVRMWNVETGKEQRSFRAVPDLEKNESNQIKRAAVSPDGTTVAIAYHPKQEALGGARVPPDVIRLWDVASGKQLWQMAGHSGSLTFSPNGRVLVTAGEVWELATTGKRLPGVAIEKPISAFSPDGRLLATASYDCTIVVWEDSLRDRYDHFRTMSLAW